MSQPSGRYSDWQQITYKPCITERQPQSLLQYLTPGQRILEVGCHSGSTVLFLARLGMQVVGVDINVDAIQLARLRAKQSGLAARVEFRLCDFIAEPMLHDYDAIVLTRVLTCIPDKKDWDKILSRSFGSIRAGGLIYVNDFLRFDDDENYRNRYKEGKSLGWRHGNFTVMDYQGNVLFVAHHHSQQDVDDLMGRYDRLDYCEYESLSMNGNACRMFEFIGRKPEGLSMSNSNAQFNRAKDE